MRLHASAHRALLVGVLGFALLASAVGQARAGETVVLGCASAADLKGLIAKLTRQAEKFIPGAGVHVQVWAATLTQAPEWMGVDWSKPATIVLVGGKAFGRATPVPVAIVALADGALFRQARPEGAPGAFEIRDNLAVVAPERAALAAMTPERLKLYSEFPKSAGTADVCATLYSAQFMAECQAEVDESLKGIEEWAAQVLPIPNIGTTLRCVGSLVNLFGKQVRRAILTIEFKDDSLDIGVRLDADDDTQLGTFFAGQPAELTDLVKYLPAEAVMSIAANLDGARAKPLSEAILKAIAAPLGIAPEDQEKLRQLMLASTQTGEGAFVLAGGAAYPGIQAAQVARIADEGKFRTASKDATEWLAKSGLGTMMQGPGLKMSVEHKPNAREYQGVQVDRITVTMAQLPDAPPNPIMMMGEPPPQVAEYAAVGTIGAGTSGSPGGELLNGVLDRIKGAGTPGFDTCATWKALQAGAPKGAAVAAHLSFNSFLAKSLDEGARQQPANPFIMMARAIIKADPAEEPITTYAAFGTNSAELRTHIPHQPILSLVTRVRMLIEQQQRPGRRPGPKPREEDDF